jgi:hypothetical protein
MTHAQRSALSYSLSFSQLRQALLPRRDSPRLALPISASLRKDSHALGRRSKPASTPADYLRFAQMLLNGG